MYRSKLLDMCRIELLNSENHWVINIDGEGNLLHSERYDYYYDAAYDFDKIESQKDMKKVYPKCAN